MKMNPILRIVLIIVVIIVVVSGIRGCVGSNTREINIESPDKGTSTGVEFSATAAEELRTVGIRLKEVTDQSVKDKQAADAKIADLEKKLATLQNDNSKQNVPDNALLNRVNQLERELVEAKKGVIGHDQIDSITENVTNTVMNTISNASKKMTGVNADECTNPLGCTQTYEVNGGDAEGPTGELVWIAPIDNPELVDKGKVVMEKIGSQLSTLTQSAINSVNNSVDTVSKKVEKIPVFTLPVNTTLFGARLTGRLLGRIPKQGSLVGVYGFTVVVPGKSVMANGHSLPDVSHALMSGWSEGDLGLLCAKGYITNMTFIFKDGRIAQVGEGFTGAKGSSTEYLAVLQDTASSECIRGSLKTNLTRFMATSMGLSALNTGAQGLVASQNTVTTSPDGGSISTPTGSIGKIIAGNMATGAASDGQKWLSERWSDTFDAILVEIGTDVTISIKKEIPIDYDPESRKVKYMSEDEAIEQAGDY
ncbi:hypothetical protein [Vibrio cholerae]|uniref:TIGR03752 family integrating conjugative element protein n=1 Tax=Vibrio cholerae TaxID=666 RepID=A0A7Z7YDS3_VIBCL|nr:hypothetical protein [Vibrio cholerae]EGR5063508.1 hypothetical protein [Vibrio cholerae]EII3728459.1 hypothetical protein [Vibrio cholerae]EMA3788884.1 hypothetical protein [Vibrio cholerae]PNV69051.1 hypothetical protein C1Y48_20360 [Vibrio cholerae]TBM41300.1 hypothetical protein EYB64_12055 [Vibrio cholerae]